jgi:hypothetical protein
LARGRARSRPARFADPIVSLPPYQFARDTYVRWLGNRKGIEEVTKTWDKTVVDRREDLTNWVELFRKFVARNLKIFAYANNHCRVADYAESPHVVNAISPPFLSFHVH